MKKKRSGQAVERRKDQVELNLLAEQEGDGQPPTRRRAGCLPFGGGAVFLLLGVLLLLTVGGLHAITG